MLVTALVLCTAAQDHINAVVMSSQVLHMVMHRWNTQTATAKFNRLHCQCTLQPWQKINTSIICL